MPGGTWLRIRDDGSVKEQRYWEVWDHTAPLSGVPEEEICERLIAELRTAVQLRKVSDVPVGVFLSGGIDSSTNAALFSEGEGRPVKTFSIGYDADYGTYKSELPFARRMANEVHAEHHERLLNQRDLLDFLPRMVQLQDEPVADPVCVPVYYVSKLARDNGVIVCQLGEGADELFCGYPTWKIHHQLQTLNNLPVPAAVKHLGLAAIRAAGKRDTFAYEMLRRGASGVPVFWGGAESFTESQKQRLISPRLRERFRNFSSWEAVAPIRRRFEQKAWEQSTLNWMSFMDLNMRLPELLLMRVDKMSMGVSLEARVPFLDHKFVELALSIPAETRYRGGKLKYLLKKAVRGIIPDELIDRKKQGFGVPVHEWLMQELGDYARQELQEFSRHTDFFDPKEIATFHSDPFGHRDSIWFLLNFVLWWKEYIAETAAPSAARATGTGVTLCSASD